MVRWRGLPLLICLLAASTAICLHVSSGRLLWSDEILGAAVVRDPSWRHMLFAWRNGADGGGLCYYVLARIWVAVLGQTDTAYRLFSATGVALAGFCTYRLALRVARSPVAAFAVLLLWFSSDAVLWQMVQARFYGLLLLAVALALLAQVRVAERERPGVGGAASLFLAHTLLAGTHPFGMVYSAALIAAMAVRDGLRRRVPWDALEGAAGWWIVLLSLPALRATAAVGKPHFWTTAPSVDDLLDTYAGWSQPAGVVLGVAAGLAVLLAVLRRRRGERAQVAETARDPLALGLGCAALLAVPAVVWAKSQWGLALFVDRYMLPVVIALAVVMAWLLERVLEAGLARSKDGAVWAGTAGAMGALSWAGWCAWVTYPSYAAYPDRVAVAPVERVLPGGIPLVVEPLDLFTRLEVYRTRPDVRYVLPLDWAYVTSAEALRGEAPGYKQMETWRRVGYHGDDIVDAATLLGGCAPFVVLDAYGLRWFETRIEGNPDFRVTLLRDYPGGRPANETLKIWRVQRVRAPCGRG